LLLHYLLKDQIESINYSLILTVSILISPLVILHYVIIHMNELDAIQQQMAALGIDVSPEAQAQAPMYDEAAALSPEDEAMFAPG
jgi:hypothetical protein